MPNYQNGKIYKLICSETNRVYIGSTVAKLCTRKSKHKDSSNTCCSKDFINPEIYLIENYPCNSKTELHSKEREYVESIDCVNKQIPGRTRKERREANKEQSKEYRKKNKERRNKYNKEYHKKNKEELNKKHKKYNEENKEKIKEWREANKEDIKGYMNEYRENNKQELNKNAREKMTCKCGGKFTRANKSIHLRTKKHQIYTIKNLT